MLLSEILRTMDVPFRCIGEKPFSSLGLTSYNNGDDVCTFIADAKYANIDGPIKMVITDETIANILQERRESIGLCIVENPRNIFFHVHNFLTQHQDYLPNKFKTILGKNCKISPLAHISENNVVIGDNVIIEEFCSIKDNTIIGNNSIIRAGSIIGAEGFEFKREEETIFGVKHVGGIRIGESVEIQSNCCIDRAIYPWDNTIIGDYSKLDDLVHMGHGVKVGKRTMIVTHSVIGGRTHVGNDCWIGIGALLRNGLEIGNSSRANMGAVVTKDIPENVAVTGNFAIEHSRFIENLKKNR